MRRRALALPVTAVAAVGAAVFVLVPAFPEPSELICNDYASLESRLGPRVVATWMLEAGLAFPLQPRSRPAEIHRCLWIYRAGYTILCTRAHATAEPQGGAPGPNEP